MEKGGWYMEQGGWHMEQGGWYMEQDLTKSDAYRILT
jgi:hypothetical protein